MAGHFKSFKSVGKTCILHFGRRYNGYLSFLRRQSHQVDTPPTQTYTHPRASSLRRCELIPRVRGCLTSLAHTNTTQSYAGPFGFRTPAELWLTKCWISQTVVTESHTGSERKHVWKAFISKLKPNVCVSMEENHTDYRKKNIWLVK